MPDQDAAENKAMEAAKAVGEKVNHLYLQAYTEGVRKGLEAAAVVGQGVADQSRVNYEFDAAIRDSVAQTAEFIRDQVRLIALQVPDPEVPGAQH